MPKESQLIQLQQADQPDSADGETYVTSFNAEEDIYHITIPLREGNGRSHFVYRWGY